MEFLRRLLSSDGFMPHGHCYLWQPGLVWLHVLSDSLIALAYISIPVTIVRFVRGRRDLPFQWIFLAIGAFVVSCGATHALEVWTLWHPTYWLSGSAKAVTAVASVATAAMLVRAAPLALALPSPAELRRTQDDLRRVNAELEGHLRSSTLQARQTAAFLEALLDSTTDAVFIKDLSGRYRLANEATARVIGKPLPEVLGRSDFELFDERMASAFVENDTRVRESGQTLTAEEPGPGAGTVYLATKGVVRDPEGRAIGTFGVSRDISERKRAEAQILRLNRVLRTLLEVNQAIPKAANPDALFGEVCRILVQRGVVRMAWIGMAEPGTHLVRAVAKAGAGLDYLEGHVVRSDDGPEGQEPIGRALRTGEASVCQDVAYDSRMFGWRERQLERGFRSSGAFPFRWGEARGVLAAHLSEPNAIGPDETDLFVELASNIGSALEVLEHRAERRRAEEALRLQKETLQAIVDNIPAMVIFFEASGRPLLVNRDFERILGWTVQEAQRVDLMAELYPDPDHRQYVAEFIGASAGRWGEFRTRTRSGRTIDTEWVNVRLSDGTIIGVGRDVTERKELEDQFRQSQKMEAVGRLAGGVAHDFNNLLGVITGYAEIVKRGLDSAHPALPRLDQVLKAAERGAGLTKQLLAFSRRQVLEPKVVDLNVVLHDLEQMLRRLIGEDVDLTVSPGRALGVVRVDPGQFEQVVMNLVVNARDAMPRGGTISIETADTDSAEFRESALGQVQEGGYVRIAVKDTGEGMDEATQARIFEPFFTTKGTGVGTGLGLATVYGIVKQSGGHIFVESALGQGTTIRIYLPRVAEQLGDLVVPPPMERVEGHETILVVEDQEALREVIREGLGELGYTVLLAESGEAALELARSHAGVIHLLLSDVVMPQLSGPDLAPLVESIRPGIKVLFMSGYTTDVLGRQGAKDRGIPLVEKPFTCEALARRVREVLSGRG